MPTDDERWVEKMVKFNERYGAQGETRGKFLIQCSFNSDPHTVLTPENVAKILQQMNEPQTDEDVLEALLDGLDVFDREGGITEVAFLDKFKELFNSPTQKTDHRFKMWSIDRTEKGWKVTRIQ